MQRLTQGCLLRPPDRTRWRLTSGGEEAGVFGQDRENLRYCKDCNSWTSVRGIHLTKEGERPVPDEIFLPENAIPGTPARPPTQTSNSALGSCKENMRRNCSCDRVPGFEKRRTLGTRRAQPRMNGAKIMTPVMTKPCPVCRQQLTKARPTDTVHCACGKHIWQG